KDDVKGQKSRRLGPWQHARCGREGAHPSSPVHWRFATSTSMISRLLGRHMGILIAIRRAELVDRPAIWSILQPVFAAGETYAVPREWTEVEASDYWCQPGHQVFVAEGGGETVGTYFLQANHGGGGGHVANCGYVTAPWATGRGIARAMCLDSLDRARA